MSISHDGGDEPETGTHGPMAVVRHDWTADDSIGTTVVEAVATFLDRSPIDLEPLQHHVDADALDGIFAHPSNGETGSEGCFIFPFHGCEVTVYTNGIVLVRDLEG